MTGIEPLGCLISLHFVVTVFMGKRRGAERCFSESLKRPCSFAPLQTHSLFPVWHWLPSCHLYFNVRSVTSLGFHSRDDCVYRRAPAPKACWNGRGACCFTVITLGFVHYYANMHTKMFVSSDQPSVCTALALD